MHASLLASLVFLAVVEAHPGHGSTLLPRTVDLNALRLRTTSKYVNASVAESNPSTRRSKRGDYVDTATELVKSIVNGATFRVVQDHYTGSNGIAHVHFKQTAHDIDIDNADFNVNVAKDGSIFSYGNSFFTGDIPSNPLTKRDLSDPVDALKTASSTLQLPIEAEKASAETTEGKETYTLKGTSGAVQDPKAKLVYIVKADGSLVLTWRVETDLWSDWLLTYVDASTNEDIHGVVDYSANAIYQVYPWGVNDPSEGPRKLVSNPWDIKASEFTWQGIGSTTYSTTRGNNGIAQSNPTGGETYLDNYRPVSATKNFSYPYDPSMTTPTDYVNASIVQLFYTANTYHDLLYELGFTEVAGNFEVNNNGQGGLGNDMLILNAQDGAGTNNARFITAPDGTPCRMLIFIFTVTTPPRDSSFDAGVIIHEYTHGLSTRLTGGPANAACLQNDEGFGMGEGWGDFMATAIALKPGDTRATDHPMGTWVFNNTGGIREYPYSTSLTTNPYVYTDVDLMTYAPHSIGVVWANMLYEVMWNLIDKYGKNDAARPSFTRTGVPTDGKYLTMKLVIDGMALQPCSPIFTSARDAIVDADKALTGGVNKCDIWKGFAKRGLGTGAVYNATKRTGSTALPSGC